MSFRNRTLLAVDGHDASGKSTLAHGLAHRFEAAYVRPYGGAEGEALMRLAAAGRYLDVIHTASEAADEAIAARDAAVVVIDRLWMTVLTLIPRQLWGTVDATVPTILCWANLATTIRRIKGRGEEQQELARHREYLHLYRAIARQYGCEIVRTDELSLDQTIEFGYRWAFQQVQERRGGMSHLTGWTNHGRGSK